MATSEQLEYVLSQILLVDPEDFFLQFHNAYNGLGGVIKILYKHSIPISAGTISEKMGISTARTAVLLKKLSDKKLIETQKDKNDARKTLVKLSESGKSFALKMKTRIYNRLNDIINRVGMEKILQFIMLSAEIKNVALDIDSDNNG